MPSSYNIIKHTNIINQGNKEIVTNIDNIRNRGNYEIESLDEIGELEQAFASELIQKAQSESTILLESAKEQAAAMRKEAYESGYSSGFEEGTNQGYTDAYEKTVKVAEQEASELIAQANAMLFSAKQEYEAYTEQKMKELTGLAISMAEKVLRRELEKADGLNEMVLEVLNESRSAKSFIIRTNGLHAEEIKKNIEAWKENLGLKSEFFIVADETLGAYYAIVEKNNGSVEIGLEAGMEGIKQAIL